MHTSSECWNFFKRKAFSLIESRWTSAYDFFSLVEIKQPFHRVSTAPLSSQVGMASLDLSTGRLYLNQYIESSRSNQNTLTLLSFYEPIAIIVSANTMTAPEGAVSAASLSDDPRFTSAEKVSMFRWRTRKQVCAHVMAGAASRLGSTVCTFSFRSQAYKDFNSQ